MSKKGTLISDMLSRKDCTSEGDVAMGLAVRG